MNILLTFVLLSFVKIDTTEVVSFILPDKRVIFNIEKELASIGQIVLNDDIVALIKKPVESEHRIRITQKVICTQVICKQERKYTFKDSLSILPTSSVITKYWEAKRTNLIGFVMEIVKDSTVKK